ncbi:MAG: hypothetical protein GC178_16625 [Flavobacteriales bacterium]|nr:hypothetical protein [Flavobacteriales bacterium]
MRLRASLTLVALQVLTLVVGMSVSLVSCDTEHSGHVEEVFPWDTIPTPAGSGLHDAQVGFYKWVYNDGSLKTAITHCDGIVNGITLEFYKDGQLAEYRVFNYKKNRDYCLFDKDGNPIMVIFDRVDYACWKDTTPCEVANRVDSIFRKYESVSKIDWEAFFKNRTCD